MPYYDTVTNVLEGALNITNDTWTALRTGSSNASGRKYLGVFNRGAYKLYISTDNTADVRHARAIRAGGERIFPYSDKVTLYGRSGGSGSIRVIVTEECG